MTESNFQNPYRDESGGARIRRSVVAFIDILGYQEKVKKAVREGEEELLLKNLRSAFDETYQHIKDEAKDNRPDWLVKGFTDNIIIGYPVRHDAEVEMGYMISNLCTFQLMMTLRGFFIRGGIAIGNLYMDDEIVFGEGLIEAFEIEQNKARDPRIILSCSAIEYLKHHLKYYSSIEQAPQYYHLLKDRDGQFFINYLYPIIEFEYDNFIGEEEILRHKQIVESRLMEHITEPPIWSKYFWVANYHNWFCDHSRHFEEKHKIDLSNIPSGPDRIQ